MGKHKIKKLPFISICTPTFNRRPFIPFMIKCFDHQDYPKDRLEWIIIDDGTDPIKDLIQDIPQVKYFYFPDKLSLGKKRNLMHQKASGDILVYMDDDDYYPPCRISHAVETLLANKNALCAGSSEMYFYFKHIDKMYQIGPYGYNHATAATFAFKKELLNQTNYEDEACLAEEKKFLKDYTIPFVQLDPLKTIIVFSHNHNTFDKKKLLTPNNKFVKESNIKLTDIIIDYDFIKFFTSDIDNELEKYTPGNIENKKDCLIQLSQMNEKLNEQKILYLQNIINDLNKKFEENVNYISGLIKENNKLKENNEYLNKKISELILRLTNK